MGSVPCPAADTKQKQPAVALAQVDEQISGPFDSRLVDKPQDLRSFLNVLGDVVHALSLL